MPSPAAIQGPRAVPLLSRSLVPSQPATWISGLTRHPPILTDVHPHETQDSQVTSHPWEPNAHPISSLHLAFLPNSCPLELGSAIGRIFLSLSLSSERFFHLLNRNLALSPKDTASPAASAVVFGSLPWGRRWDGALLAPPCYLQTRLSSLLSHLGYFHICLTFTFLRKWVLAISGDTQIRVPTPWFLLQ